MSLSGAGAPGRGQAERLHEGPRRLDLEGLLGHLREAEKLVLAEEVNPDPGTNLNELHECKIAIWGAMGWTARMRGLPPAVREEEQGPGLYCTGCRRMTRRLYVDMCDACKQGKPDLRAVGSAILFLCASGTLYGVVRLLHG